MAHEMYLTFDEYKGRGGSALSLLEYPPVEFKCRKRIDYLTDNRIQRMENIPEAVKFCMFSLINVEGKAGTEAQLANPTVTSYSTDGYSETYGNAISASDAQKSIDTIIHEYLYGETDDNGVPLLYRGVSGYASV